MVLHLLRFQNLPQQDQCPHHLTDRALLLVTVDDASVFNRSIVKDQEVFAERASSMNYSEEAKRAAHLGILHALRLVRRRQFPFDGHADDVMRRILGGTRAAK